MIAANPRRRASDRAPLTSRLTWAAWRLVYRLERAAPAIVGSCVIAVFWLLLVFCLLSPQP